MSSVTAARTDDWHCASCGAAADLASVSAEIGLVRLAGRGAEGFRLGSAGIEAELAPLLAPCRCGGPLEPGRGAAGAGRISPRFDADALEPVAGRGLEVLEQSADPRLRELARVWRPRALRAAGRGAELTKPELLELKLEGRLQGLLEEIERAREAGDEDAMEAAHARYVELGTTYVQRFVRGRGPGADG